MNFADVQEQGFTPLYRRKKITDNLHEAEKAKAGNKLPYSVRLKGIVVSFVFKGITAILIISICQRWGE